MARSNSYTRSATCILMPAYLCYKSLRTGDPALVHSWAIYFIMLSLFLLAESWIWIVTWIPFYSWFRLFFLLYLVLPQTQGAKHLYLEYFEPYIVHHERQIDDFIGQTHRQLEHMGLGYMNIVVEWLREKVLGQASPQPRAANVAPGAGGYGSYATDLLSRFAMPAARTQAAPAVTGGAGGVFNMLSSAAGLAGGSATGSSRSIPASQSGGVPDNFLSGLGTMSSDQKSTFISSQRDRLAGMMKALDKEQQNLDLAYGDSKGTTSSRRPPSSSGGEFTKSRSQMSFDTIDYDDVHSGNGSGYPSQHSTPPTMRQSSGQGRRTTSGNWVPNLGGWLGGSSPQDPKRDEHDRRDERDMPRGYRDERRSPRVSGGVPDEDDGYLSKGWSTARDITDTIARSTRDSGRERDRYDR